MTLHSIDRIRRIRTAVLTSIVVVLLSGATVYAQGIIDVVSANVGQTQVAFNNMWDIPVAPPADLTNGSVIGSGLFWQIAPSGRPPGDFTWTGNPLIADLSSGGQADGMFGAGGTMTITGELWDIFNPFAPIFVGVLLEADVSAFEMLESTPDSDMIDLVGSATVHPTGGYLMTNPTLRLAPGLDYSLSFTGQGAQQNGGPLASWQDSFVSVDASEFTLVVTPEPTSLVTWGGFMALLAIRRRRRRAT